ncbi:DUF5666 domain-containing protein [Marinobacter sp.]|uniref:DUF5666 domain-containing protein n=1 Tax=Marinobacter sp. TaxID=50741 RepID=UPI003562A473
MIARPASRLATIGLLSATLSLAACGGAGGGASGGGGLAEGGIRGTGSSVGPVSGFGSVFVNGIRFITENLGIDDFEGEAGVPVEADLEKGMILQIRGEWQDDGEGQAELVRYDDTLRGPVTSVTQPWDDVARQGRIEVMGFEVTLDRLTQTTLADLATITVDQPLRVSGWLQADGSFRASFIGPVTSADRAQEIEGYLSVTGEEGNERYFVDGLELQIPSGAVCDELELADGTPVDAEGEYSGGAAFIVSEICNGPTAFLDESLDEDVQIAGVVTEAFDGEFADGRFSLNGTPVTTDGNTEVDDLAPSDINPGVLLQVEGRYINEDGVLTLEAEEIEYRDADAEVEGTLDGVDGDVLWVGGVEIRQTPFTIREDDDDDDEGCPEVIGSELIGRVALEVAGIQRSDAGYLEALEIECESDVDDTGYQLEGRIEALNRDAGSESLTVLGAVIRVGGDTGFDDVEFADLSEGDRVEVDYVADGSGGYIAEEIELEEDDD